MVSDVSGLIVTITAMAGGSVSSSFLLVNLHGVRSPMRPKNVILLEKNIIVTNFNDVDLLYYLFLDAFVAPSGMVHHGGRGTVLAPTLSLLAPYCLIFLRTVCVFASTWPEALKPFLGPVAGAGRQTQPKIEQKSRQQKLRVTATPSTNLRVTSHELTGPQSRRLALRVSTHVSVVVAVVVDACVCLLNLCSHLHTHPHTAQLLVLYTASFFYSIGCNQS